MQKTRNLNSEATQRYFCMNSMHLWCYCVLGSLNGVNKENIHKTVPCQPSRFPHGNLTSHSSSFNLCQDLSRALGSSANSLQRTEVEGGWKGGIGSWMAPKLSEQYQSISSLLHNSFNFQMQTFPIIKPSHLCKACTTACHQVEPP